MIGTLQRLLARWRFSREHRWTHTRLSAYLDGELEARERRRVEDHVGVCPQCWRVLRTLRRTVEGLARLADRPRRDVAEGVVQRLRRERAGRH